MNWAVKLGPQPNKSGPLVLKQAGNLVKGEYIQDFYFPEATVVGNTLRFKMRNHLFQGEWDGEFVMDAGGKSFKGKINGDAATGTFVRP